MDLGNHVRGILFAHFLKWNRNTSSPGRRWGQDRVEEKLPRVRTPVLVVRGQCDPICQQHWAEEVIHRLPHGRLIVIPGVAHTLVYTSPLELARVTCPFVDKAADQANGEETLRDGGLPSTPRETLP